MGNIFAARVQMGREGTAGNEVDASQFWRGLAGFLDEQQTLIFVDEHIGSIPGKDRTYIPQVLAGIAFPDTPATFEQITTLFAAGIQDDTPAADGGGSGKIYVYQPPVDWNQPGITFIKTYTIETGDEEAAEVATYCVPAEFSLKGAMGEALMVSSTWFGRQAATTTFTSGLSYLAVEEILTQKGIIYIDNAGSLGGTPITNSISQFELSVTTGWIPRFTAGGELFFSKAVYTRPEILLSIVFEHEDQVVAEKVLMRAQTARSIRLIFTGSELGTSGTTYTYKTLIIDLAGKWETFDTISESDGVSEVAATFRARDNDTENMFAKFTVVNESAGYP